VRKGKQSNVTVGEVQKLIELRKTTHCREEQGKQNEKKNSWDKIQRKGCHRKIQIGGDDGSKAVEINVVVVDAVVAMGAINW